MYRYTNISFPSLGIDIDPIRQFSVGPLTIHLYGVVIAFGLVLATMYGMRRSKEFGLTEDHVLDGVLWITPFAILCARAYYCIFSWELYADDPISVLYIWKGGIAIYGGVLGAIVGMIVFCRIKKISLGATLDLVLMGFLIGQAIGRWGNFFNREAFGAETESFLRMGLLNALTGEIPTTIPPSCMSQRGTRWALWFCISCPKSGNSTARSPWATPSGTDWAGLSSRACGPTASTSPARPCGSASFWRL